MYVCTYVLSLIVTLLLVTYVFKSRLKTLHIAQSLCFMYDSALQRAKRKIKR